MGAADSISCTENSRLDPNDPRNAELLQLMESIPSSSEQANYFQLASVDDVQAYVTDNEFNTDKRFVMLKMRGDGVGLPVQIIRTSSFFNVVISMVD